MSTKGKRLLASRAKVEVEKRYELDEALALVKETATAKFDETVELAVSLGVDPRKADQLVRGAVVLPHGTGKTIRVLVFAKGDQATEAEEAGADHVGGEELAERIQKEGWLEFDKCVATPDMMRVVGKLGRILGPRGMMPNPKVGTVTMDVGRVVREMKGGRVEYRVEKAGIIHAPVGKVSFDLEQLKANVLAIIDALIRAKPQAAKGVYMRGVALSATMGPGVRVDPAGVQQLVRV